ncbi:MULTISPECIES: flagellar hook assembly protein FlgD [unclassified Variovorax]|uniref:flagellar hook assembly protein FlgD n=1 Tax=unclassified Variovorax TaxID=663243 RepID=UPI002B238864|nr:MULTISPECIES: flagellar hook capping FlgD N-terminal domain-containing protein [unclassified Variovorax]MEB0058543.1 flagellar hook capping FlgD N-terminal domain-containing protein [Variovorax sp. LG9.2]MEB0112020.1 flagellar hook capping FlgD N-terminal domain-containing protein [Variovorax sp. RTB1]
MTATSATSAIASSTSSYNISSSADKAASTGTSTSSADIQDRFLKLLVAQLSNQDPMNPMDNAQMTTQMAQINTVTGIESLNTTMKAMAAQMSSQQMLQSGDMVGRSVLTEGNQIAIDGTTAVGAVELATGATDVKVQVMTAGGQIVDTVSLGKLDAGQHGFSLDASNYPAGAALQFKVVATNGSDAVQSTALMRDKVVAVGSDAAGLTLTLLSAGVTPYAKVHTVL